MARTKVSRSASESAAGAGAGADDDVDEEIGIKGTYLNAGKIKAEAKSDDGSADGAKEELVITTLLYG